jgi:prevent-host-death family protein
MKTWQLQKAKAQFSEVVRDASVAGPQVITVRGEDEAVVLSMESYRKLLDRKPSFLAFMDRSPLKGINLSIVRDRSRPRSLDL